MRKFYFVFFLLVVFSPGFSQKLRKLKVHELNLVVDNDILLLLDRYYSAGQDITYRKMINKNGWLSNWFNQRSDSTNKFFIYYRYGNKIFTPRSVSLSDPKRMDRPYAGWSFVDAGITKFKGLNKSFQLEMEIGLVGHISGMENLQKWWHKHTSYPKPMGWNSQIQNEFVVNMNYHFVQRLKMSSYFDALFNTGLHIGTGSNRATEHVTFRLGNINSLSKSVFFNGRLGARNPEFMDEVFFYFGMGVDYVASNIFVEGSLFNNRPSAVSATLNPIFIREYFGVMHSGEIGSFSMGFTLLGREVMNNLHHGYATINYAIRF